MMHSRKPKAKKSAAKTKTKAKTKSKAETKAGGTAKKTKSKASDIEDWNALRTELIECLETFETRAFTECLEKYRGRTLNGKPLADVLSGVERKAQAFDFEGAIAELNVIGGDA